MTKKVYPKLYSKSNTGKVLVWWMEQDGNKYVTKSGQQEGKITSSIPQVAVAMNRGRANETSAVKQATKEIEAKYKKQLKTGYFEDIKDIDKQQYFQVMLAQEYKKQKKLDWQKGFIVQIKFNGHRCVATKDGLFTRKGERYVSVPHIEESLKEFFQIYPDAILDGELFNYELRQQLNELSSLVRKQKPTPEDLQRSKEIVQYHVYDGFGFGPTQIDGITSQDSPYVQRKKAINETLTCYSNYVYQVTDFYVDNPKELEKIYQSFLSHEQEGAILRVPDSPYENKRSKYLLKYKPVDDAEFQIVDIIEGTGNWSGTGKIIVLRDVNKVLPSKRETKEFRASFKGSREQAKKFLLEKKKWIGKIVTVEYNNLTGLGVPNFARVDYSNCLKG